MLPTPYPPSSVDYKYVYEPAEDSFLLLDILETEKEFLDKRFAYPLVCEIGTGSGIVTTFASKYIMPNGLFISTDINHKACEALQATCKENSARHIDAVRSSFVDALRTKPDVLIFNPPYVPNENVPQRPGAEDINNETWLDLALEGGEDGMEITNQLLDNLRNSLAEQGVAYILFCKRNKPEEVAEKMKSRGWVATRIEEKRAGWEVLSVWRFERTANCQ